MVARCSDCQLWQGLRDYCCHLLPSIIVAGAIYGAAALAIGKELLPGSAMFAILVIWTAAQVGGELSKLLRVPPLVGMLLSGVVLANMPGGIASDVPESWSVKIRASALSMILMRSGLELDLKVLATTGAAAMRLTACPGIMEALVVAGAAAWLFNMPFTLGLTLGFILAAVSPAVVVSGMFDLQNKGFGVRKGIPSIVVAAASFDDILAITGYALFIGIAVGSGHSLAMDLAHGPISILGGVVFGVLGGILVGSTRLWRTPVARIVATLATSQLLMFIAVHFHYTGAGAMGGLIMAIVASKMWSKPPTKMPSWYCGEESSEFPHEVEQAVAEIWRAVAQPLLFGIIGTVANFRVLDAAVIPKAVAIIAFGVCVRLPTAFLVTYGAGLTVKERLFIGGSWLAKATVQAALASTPLDLIHNTKSNDEDFEKWRSWGNDIVTTAIFSIVLTAPSGLIFISTFGEKWLTKDNVHIHAVPVTYDLDATVSRDSLKEKVEQEEPDTTGHSIMPTIPSIREEEVSVFDSVGGQPVASPTQSPPKSPVTVLSYDVFASKGALAAASSLGSSPVCSPHAHAGRRHTSPQSEVCMPAPSIPGEHSASLSGAGVASGMNDKILLANQQQLLGNIRSHAQKIWSSTESQDVVDSARAIDGAVEELQVKQAQASIAHTLHRLNSSDPSAGNFFRIARRTTILEED